MAAQSEDANPSAAGPSRPARADQAALPRRQKSASRTAPALPALEENIRGQKSEVKKEGNSRSIAAVEGVSIALIGYVETPIRADPLAVVAGVVVHREVEQCIGANNLIGFAPDFGASRDVVFLLASPGHYAVLGARQNVARLRFGEIDPGLDNQRELEVVHSAELIARIGVDQLTFVIPITGTKHQSFVGKQLAIDDGIGAPLR